MSISKREPGETAETLLGKLRAHLDAMEWHEAKADELRWMLRQLLPPESPLLDWGKKQ